MCSVATNNVLNPFTPFGDASLLRMANFYANVAHAGISEFDACLDLVTELPARLMNLRDYGIAPGNPADLVILDTDSSANAIAELPDMLMRSRTGGRCSSGGGRRCFRRLVWACCAVGGFILRDGALAPPQDEVWYRTVSDPHGEERGEAARLEPCRPRSGLMRLPTRD